MKPPNLLPVEQPAAPEGMWVMADPYFLGLWLFASLFSAWKGWLAPSIFTGSVFVFFSASKLWGMAALRRVSCEICASRAGLFPGQKLALTRVVGNAKLLPLFGLEILEAYDPNGCLQAGERYVTRHALEGKPSYFCLYALAMVKWRQTVRFTDEWMAVRRGVRFVGSVELRSGDFFGLCPQSRRFSLGKACMVAVYPALVGVDVELALRNIWDSYSSSAGSLEDAVWVKSVRDYLPQDPARRINQRLLAKGQGLKANQYEVVAPDDILFIMDTASYLNAPDTCALEESMSILASMLSGLQAKGFRAGLLVSRSGYFPQTYVSPSSRASELARMLELLAASQASDPPLNKAQANLSAAYGQVYYVAYSLEAATSLAVLGQFPPYKCQILALAQEPASRSAGGWRVRSLSALRKH